MLQLQNREKKIKKIQQQNFNRQHKATNLKPLNKGDTVWLLDRKCNLKGIVIQKCASRSYVRQTDEQGTLRQNCKMLLQLPSEEKVIKPNMNTSKTPNNAQQPVVVIPKEQHPISQNPKNHQVTKIRSGHVFQTT